MDVEYYLINILSPHLPLKNQIPRFYLTTEAELAQFSGGCIKIGIELNDIGVVSTLRYLRGYTEVNVVHEKKFEKSDKKGIIEAVQTSKGIVRVIYTDLVAKVLYVSSDDKSFYRGYYANLTNLGKVSMDGYIPMDKELGTGNIEIIKHNKRQLIKRGAIYIHNSLRNTMGFVDNFYDSEEAMISDMKKENLELDLGYFIDSIVT